MIYNDIKAQYNKRNVLCNALNIGCIWKNSGVFNWLVKQNWYNNEIQRNKMCNRIIKQVNASKEIIIINATNVYSNQI